MQRVLDRVIALDSKRRGSEQKWLSTSLGLSIQTVQNWKDRGIPPRRYGDVAKVLGWTRDELVGEALPKALPAVAWPFEDVPKDLFDALTERQKGVVEKAMLDAIAGIQGSRRKQAGMAE